MKNKNEIKLYENEVLEYDVDNLIEEELKDFHNKIKNIKEDEILQFKNWMKIYKSLNYDIFEGLTISKIYRFNKFSAVVELTFNKEKEYDLLAVNEEDKTVGVMNVKNGSVKKKVVRRLLLPETPEEALMYASSEMDADTIESIGQTIKELETNGDKYDVTKKVGKYLGLNTKETKKENKVETKKENKSIEKPKVEKEKVVVDNKVETIEVEEEIDEMYIVNLLRNNKRKEAIKLLNNVLYKDVKEKFIKDILVDQFLQNEKFYI